MNGRVEFEAFTLKACDAAAHAGLSRQPLHYEDLFWTTGQPSSGLICQPQLVQHHVMFVFQRVFKRLAGAGAINAAHSLSIKMLNSLHLCVHVWCLVLWKPVMRRSTEPCQCIDDEKTHNGARLSSNLCLFDSNCEPLKVTFKSRIAIFFPLLVT